MIKVILTGSRGRLGKELINAFASDVRYSTTSTFIPTTRKDFDLSDRDSVYEYIKREQPDVIIHAGAETNVVLCEKDRELAWGCNVFGTENIVSAVRKFCPDCHVVYMSTPCCFEGGEEPIYEYSLPYPKNFYGLTKFAGELLVRSLKYFCVVRSNFVPQDKWEHPRAFSDRFSNYLFARDLALAIKEVMESGIQGTIHIVGDKKMSMFELSQLCRNAKEVQPYTLEEYYTEHPTSPKLTKNMLLESTRWKKYKIGFSYEEVKE